MEIRREQKRDFEQIFSLNALAFESEGEAKLVDILRSVAGFISLVADEDSKIVGHIAFSPVTLNGQPTNFTGLAPMSVLPEFQRNGIGGKLIRAGLDECRKAGYGAVFVLGHIGYYPRFGFEPASNRGFKCEYPVPDEAFMVLELVSDSLADLNGLIKYDRAFSEPRSP